MLDNKLARDGKNDMTLVTPVAGNIAGAVLDEPKLYFPELPCAHRCSPRLAQLNRCRNT